MKKVKFVAILSGDYECFTFAVTKDIYKRITDRNPDKYTKNRFHGSLYNLYPNDIFGLLPDNKTIEVMIEWGVIAKERRKDG